MQQVVNSVSDSCIRLLFKKYSDTGKFIYHLGRLAPLLQPGDRILIKLSVTSNFILAVK